MSVEKLVMELFGRVTTLEEANKDLIRRIEQLENDKLNKNIKEEIEEIKITRSVTRQHVIQELKKNNPEFQISKGNRELGADLILKVGNISYPLKANFYHSKSHNEGFVRGWHTVKRDDLPNEDIQFYVFVVEYNSKFHTWLFSRVDLLVYCQQKEVDANNLYHFYFTIKDGKNYEARDGEIDVSRYYEQWDLPSKYMRVI